MTERLIPKLPDLQWADPLGKQILLAMDRVTQAIGSVNEMLYLQGLWQGAVTASLILMICLVASRK